MAILNFGGFEHGKPASFPSRASADVYEWQTVAARASLSTTTVHDGGRALHFDDTGFSYDDASYEIRNPAGGSLAWSSGTQHVYFWFRMDQAPSEETAIVVFEVYKLTLRITNGTTNIYLTGSSTSSTIALTLDTWHLIHIEFVSGGTCSLDVDGGTPVTAGSHGGTIPFVRFAGESAAGLDAYWDSWVLSDAVLGYEPAVYCLDPDGDGANTAWTGTYADADETDEDGDTSYLTTSSAAAKETVTLESTTSAGVVGTIKAVKTQAVIRDEGGAASVETLLRPGSTDREGGENVDPGTSYVSMGAIWETNPDTTAAWTASELDATEIGVLNNNAVAVRATRLALMVLTDGVAEVAAASAPLLPPAYRLQPFLGR